MTTSHRFRLRLASEFTRDTDAKLRGWITAVASIPRVRLTPETRSIVSTALRLARREVGHRARRVAR